MTMTEKFKILAKYIKDMSSETPDVETYISACLLYTSDAADE